MTRLRKMDRRSGLSGETRISAFSAGDRVFVTAGHPWAPNVGTCIAYEKYGLGWWGWRVSLDNPLGQECYCKDSELRHA